MAKERPDYERRARRQAEGKDRRMALRKSAANKVRAALKETP